MALLLGCMYLFQRLYVCHTKSNQISDMNSKKKQGREEFLNEEEENSEEYVEYLDDEFEDEKSSKD